MNIILLTPIILTLALVHGGGVFFKGNNMTSNLAPYPSQPCQGESERDAFKKFAKKHILQRDFDTNSEEAWGEYLKDKNLCGRVPVQSFINKADEENVLQICTKAGRHLQCNLCISSSTMTVYDVKSKKSKTHCRIEGKVEGRERYVIVACNKIKNRCLPVHYQKYNNEKPGDKPCF